MKFTVHFSLDTVRASTVYLPCPNSLSRYLNAQGDGMFVSQQWILAFQTLKLGQGEVFYLCVHRRGLSVTDVRD